MDIKGTLEEVLVKKTYDEFIARLHQSTSGKLVRIFIRSDYNFTGGVLGWQKNRIFLFFF